jgi:hypothetical protein
LTRAAEAEEIAQAGAKEVISKARSDLREVRAKLGQRERELDAREAKVTEAEAASEKSQFGDGIWQVGIDIISGVYRSPGGGSCYWAKLGSANTDDIVNNGGFTPNQTIEVDSPWFQSSGCGTWQKL